jgi:hypothetical protein
LANGSTSSVPPNSGKKPEPKARMPTPMLRPGAPTGSAWPALSQPNVTLVPPAQVPVV